MTTILNQPFNINGVISTEKTVLQNLNTLCNACASFLTYDVNDGKWNVVINRPENSIASFNDSNIIGNISISETSVNDLYNSVSIEYPNPDVRDEVDFVDLVLDLELRYPNEVDNNLEIQLDCINNPIQAQYLASIELKQSRLNKVITFAGDYTSLGLKAGSVIDVTSEQYGFVNKKFRIINLEESDDDIIGLKITGLEYSEEVYSQAGLTRKDRIKATGILLQEQNDLIRSSNDVDVGNQLSRLLLANLGAGLLRNLFGRISGTNKFGPVNQQAEEIDKLLSNARKPPLTTISGPDQLCAGNTMTITAGHTCTSCLFNIPEFNYNYNIIGLFEDDIQSISINGQIQETVKLEGQIPITTSGSIAIAVKSSALEGRNSEAVTVSIGNQVKAITVYSIPTYSYNVNASTSSITEGQSVTFTVTTTGVANGTVIPYTISGPASGKVTSPALTGNVTINSNTASLVVNTNDDAIYTGDQSLTFTINPGVPSNPCATLDFTADVTVVDNETPPPPVPDDTTCEYVLVPAVWCAIYDGTDNQMKAVTVRKSVYLPVAQAGEATVNVPTAISVTKGNPSTINVTSTTAVASSSNLGGMPIRIITSFNTVSPRGLITGTGVTVYGYII